MRRRDVRNNSVGFIISPEWISGPVTADDQNKKVSEVLTSGGALWWY